MKEYANGRKAQFIEDAVFKTIIPKDTTVNDAVNKLINDGVNDKNGGINDENGGENDGVNEDSDGVNDGVKIQIIRIAEFISEKEGVNALEIATKLSKSKPTIERYLRTAKNLGIIEFRGADKTGGYYLTDKMKNIKNE